MFGLGTITSMNHTRKRSKIRQVFNSSKVVELFATQAQESARTPGHSGHIYFDRETIYSYGSHFPIASHVTSTANGGKAALFTTRDYSVTTSGHKSSVRCALNRGTSRI